MSDFVDGKLYQIDPDGGPVLGEIPLVGYGFGQPDGCVMADITGFGRVLAILFHDPSGRVDPSLALFSLDYTPVESKSWGRIKAMYREDE